MKDIVVVIGSANVDIVCRVERLPRPGETVLARGSSTFAGGKGLNQAVAAARAGAVTRLVASVGTDDRGATLRDAMVEAGIDTSLVRSSGAHTGMAFIAVDDQAENTIIVDVGANADLLDLSATEIEAIATANIVVAQMEIPLNTVLAAARAALGRFVLNAAPIRDIPAELLELVDILVVNETEAAILGEAAAAVDVVIRTLGALGAEIIRPGREVIRVPAPAVRAVDTTGAGDTFVGALAALLAEGAELEAAVHFAAVAGAISVERQSAAPSIPMRAEIDARI